MDFTLKVYRVLLATLKNVGYDFQPFEGFLEKPLERVVVLRHDVDLLPANSLMMARLEREMGVTGSYYFRAVPESFDEAVVRDVHGLGHEVGYHYENMDVAGRGYGGWPVRWIPRKGRVKKDYSEEEHVDAAFKDFKVNLERFREVVPVRTVAMHGSPRSRFNNLDIWKRYDYRGLGIIGEPYMDIDFSDVFYLTDTGRRWDGGSFSVRDRVESGFSWQELRFRHTCEIIDAARRGVLPSRIMINVHPQRWTDSLQPWLKELVWQNVKNQVKRFVVGRR